MKLRKSLFKYHSTFYNVQRNDDVNHRGMKLRWNKIFPSLNVLNRKLSLHGSKGVLRHYHYRSDTKIGPGIFVTRRITFSFQACTIKLSLPRKSTIKDTRNQTKYRKVYDCKYSLVIGSHNNWIIINFLGYGTDNVEYEFIDRTILYGNIMNMSLIVLKGNYGDIDAYETS